MNNRLKLHSLLQSFGCPNIYYQAPSSLKYPCIKYEKDKIINTHADSMIYKQDDRYSITIMSKNVDDILINKVSTIPGISYDRSYTSDNIYHTVFELHY